MRQVVFVLVTNFAESSLINQTLLGQYSQVMLFSLASSDVE
jgi:hypothetical protein